MIPWGFKIDSNGLTLIEVLIAMTAFCFGILGVFEFQLAVTKGNLCSRHLTTAVFLTESKMEDLKAKGFGNNTNGSDEIYMEGKTFTRSWTNVPNYLGSSDMEQINITVTWSDSYKTHSFSLDSVLSSTMD